MIKNSTFLKIGIFICLMICVFVFNSCLYNKTINTEISNTDSETGIKIKYEEKQYLAADPENTYSEYLSDDKSIYIIYAVNSLSSGYIEGVSVQDITDGSSTSVVKATANLGYKFVRWSDGLTAVSRSDDTSDSTEIITAVFDYDMLEMPVICITTETGSDVTSKTEYINAKIDILNCDSQYETVGLDSSIRGRGNNTWGYEKKSYKLKLSGKKNLLGIGDGDAKTWVLMANMCDQSLLRNHMAFSFSKSLSGIAFAPSSLCTEVYLNGEYRGVYLLAEEIQINKNRLDINNSTDETDIGYLVELSYYAEDSTVFNVAERKYHIISDISNENDLRVKQIAYITDYMNQCRQAVNGGDRATIEKLINIDSFVDTYIAEEVLKNLDFGFDSFYLHKDKGGKLCFGPIWDFDLSLGNSNETCEYYYNFYAAIDAINGVSNPWYYTIMKNRWFRELVIKRWDEIRDILHAMPDNVLEYGQKYYNSFCRNFEKWQIFGSVMNRETPLITSLSTYKEHYNYLSGWMKNRIKWLDDNIHTEFFLNGIFNVENLAFGNSEASVIIKTYRSLNSYILKNTVSGPEGYYDESVKNAFDGSETTKYCFAGSGVSEIYFNTSIPVAINAYIFQTANDNDNYQMRNPDSWIIYGSNDPNTDKNNTWTIIASEPDGDSLVGTTNFTYYGIMTDNKKSYQYFCLAITDYEIVQFAEFIIYGNQNM